VKRSTDGILTTHTGSLPRPADLVDMIYARQAGSVGEQAFQERVADAVDEVVRRQVDAGLTVVNDGEQPRISYTIYVTDRLSGFGGEGRYHQSRDVTDFPTYAERVRSEGGDQRPTPPACIGPVTLTDPTAVERDIANLRSALRGVPAQEGFLTSVSPGQLARFIVNEYYPTHEEYLYALAEAMRPEYEAIAAAGLVLQLDCPDLASGRSNQFADLSLAEFRDIIRLHIEVLNVATANIPPEQMRIHICWGNAEGPHHRDIPLADVVDLVLQGRPSAISFEAANPRHEHEWRLFEDAPLPEGKVVIPGVIDSTTNYIEHPELVAQRIERFAAVVGRENVIAGTDCGFGNFAGKSVVDNEIAWAKLASLAEGAAIATDRLWSKARPVPVR
jgi:5-methyltetrahydropteroyltriglutamate--homocysteine methyltransferase